MDASTGGDTESIDTELVTVNYLSLLGVRPVMGRDFTAEEEQPGAPASVIISDSLWRRAFGAEPAALGRTLRLNGRGFTVVGVPAIVKFAMTLTSIVAITVISYHYVVRSTAVGALLNGRRYLRALPEPEPAREAVAV